MKLREVLSMSEKVTLRFTRWIGDGKAEFRFFANLIEPILGKKLTLVTNPNTKVDIEISSVYGESGSKSLLGRVHRNLVYRTPGPSKAGSWLDGFNLQPNKKAKVNIFWTGENDRPPNGAWDALLSFDLDSYGGKNAYLPLWWITCTDLAGPQFAPYLNEPISVSQLMTRRKVNYSSRDKFCITFIGKAYSFRIQAIKALSTIEPVHIYGSVVKKIPKSKYKKSKKYRFVLCFENDLYPGYVTEKAFEAWMTGAIPLYWGDDPQGYINPKAVINLKNFENLAAFVKRVNEINNSKSLWEKIASEPILLKAPDLSDVNAILKQGLKSLYDR